jgi:2'-5' RNA ligase
MAAYALTPDEAHPETWRLPLYHEDGTPHAGRIRYAMGRLSPDAHPTIPVRWMAEARRRILDAWSELHPDGVAPSRLLRADYEDDDVDRAHPNQYTSGGGSGKKPPKMPRRRTTPGAGRGQGDSKTPRLGSKRPAGVAVRPRWGDGAKPRFKTPTKPRGKPVGKSMGDAIDIAAAVLIAEIAEELDLADGGVDDVVTRAHANQYQGSGAGRSSTGTKGKPGASTGVKKKRPRNIQQLSPAQYAKYRPLAEGLSSGKISHADFKKQLAAILKADVTFEGDPESSGVMLCFGLDDRTVEALAIHEPPDGVIAQDTTQMHLTVMYLGDIETWPMDLLDLLVMHVRSFIVRCGVPPLTGKVSGGGVFINGDAATVVALAQVEGLDDFSDSLEHYLAACGFHFPDGFDSYIPHITLAEGTVDSTGTLPLPETVPLAFGELLLVAGDQVWEFSLDGPLPMAPDPGEMMGGGYMGASSDGYMMAAVERADERRYTFTPLYVPGALDSHGEWVTADDLQTAVWEFMRTGNRVVNAQHAEGTVAGEVVEMVSWPFEATVDMMDADGELTTVTLPPGTVYQGTVWEPWAWKAIKAGKITGVSLQGGAVRVRTSDEVHA